MESRVFSLPDGSQVLVMYWPEEAGIPVQVAVREDPYGSWGPPLKEVAK